MKILLDGHMIGTKEGGNERYIKNLYESLARINKQIELYISNENNFKRLAVSIPKTVKNKHIDIVHSTYNPPFIKNTKFVVTLHDLSFKRFPQFYNFRERFMFQYLLPFSLSQADAIIVPSQFSKKEAQHFFPAYSNKIFVTYEAADPLFHHKDRTISQKKIKDKYHIFNPFLLTLNSKNPKKNIQLIIDAFNEYTKTNRDIELVIIGGSHNINEETLYNKIHIFDFIEDTDLNDFYNSCEIFIYFSLYEGFGLPILEAIQCHAPVIASDIEVHREITQNKIVYADPNNSNALTEKIEKILMNNSYKNQLIKKSQTIIDHYSWDKTARETYQVYKKVLSQ